MSDPRDVAVSRCDRTSHSRFDALNLRPIPIQVAAWNAPFDYCHDRYQAYYVASFQRYLEAYQGDFRHASGSVRSRLLRTLRTVRHSYRLRKWLGKGMGLIDGCLDRCGRVLDCSSRTPSGRFHSLVGQYVMGAGNHRVNLCIDSSDSGQIAAPELLGWCDLYFKTNFWADRSYPAQIRPLANGNPLVLDHLEHLRCLRNAPKIYDLAFIVRVWGGEDEVGGIEHNLRLLEAVNTLKCKKFLLAYLVAGDISTHARRLDRQGIPWTREPIPLQQLWQISASSRVVVIRLGMHHCLPWRMVDTLAMGACPVLDQPPRTRWHQPLNDGDHFETLGVTTSTAGTLAAEGLYQAIPRRLEKLLDDSDLVQRIGHSTARYFDEFLAPIRLGEYMVDVAGLKSNATEGQR